MDHEIAGFQASLARLMALFDSVPETMVDRKPSASDWSVRQTVYIGAETTATASTTKVPLRTLSCTVCGALPSPRSV